MYQIVLFLYCYLALIFQSNPHTFYYFNHLLYWLFVVTTINWLSPSNILNSFSIGLNFKFQLRSIFTRPEELSCFQIMSQLQRIAAKAHENQIILVKTTFLQYFNISQHGQYITPKLNLLTFRFNCIFIIDQNFLKNYNYAHFQDKAFFTYLTYSNQH